MFATLLLFPLASARAQEIIHLRTGQVGGAPGTCGQPDDRFRYDPGFTPGSCGQPLRNAPFAAADFAAAATGPAAKVVDPFNPWWLPGLPADPLARWIDWDRNGTCNGSEGSILYSCRFTVETPCATAGDISVCWAVDDILGDPVGGGPNPFGIYLNGVALSPAFAGGGLGSQSCAAQSNVPLLAGENVLYVYQRDQFCTVSGLMLSAVVTVTNASCGETGVALPGASCRLYTPTPNPFNPATTIRFELPAAATVRLAIHDVNGRLVRVLVAGELSAGSHEARWNGTGEQGQRLPSGVYFCRLEAGSFRQTASLTLLK